MLSFLGTYCHIWIHEAPYSLRSHLGCFRFIYVHLFVKIMVHFLCLNLNLEVGFIEEQDSTVLIFISKHEDVAMQPLYHVRTFNLRTRKLGCYCGLLVTISPMPNLAVCEEPHKKK